MVNIFNVLTETGPDLSFQTCCADNIPTSVNNSDNSICTAYIYT